MTGLQPFEIPHPLFAVKLSEEEPCYYELFREDFISMQIRKSVHDNAVCIEHKGNMKLEKMKDKWYDRRIL